jgi:hypothetical protein
MNLNIFVAHSNKFIALAIWFSEFLKTRNLEPIIMELIPNAGRLWSPAEKENHLLSLCETALVIATPDEIQDGRPVPRLDVSFEIGRLRESKKTIILKEKSVKLPTSLEPICVYFSLERPQECLENLDRELESIFGKNVNTQTLFDKEPPKIEQHQFLRVGNSESKTDTHVMYCRRCGAIAGTQSECIGVYTYHDFTSGSGTVYCSRCGVTIGKRSKCIGIYTYHDFRSGTGKVFCSRCGKEVGERSACIGIYTYHNFSEI